MAKVSEEGLALIRSMEGLSLDAYPDGPGWSIGYGHHGADVHQGETITQQQADDLLRQDVAKFEQGVEDLLAVPAEQEEFDSMVSLAYNVGLGAFRDSTLLRHHNAGLHGAAANEFSKWNKSGGEVQPGLVKRRDKEAALYRKGGRA